MISVYNCFPKFCSIKSYQICRLWGFILPINRTFVTDSWLQLLDRFFLQECVRFSLEQAVEVEEGVSFLIHQDLCGQVVVFNAQRLLCAVCLNEMLL